MQFRTKARAVDLLGKGQIADLPTAITELWKNGYDAYADILTAEIYLEGYKGLTNPLFVMTDDGKGMSQKDIFEKWLVLGTDSKSRGSSKDEEGPETLWKKPRIKAGEKGIGRLSVAYLGSPMLMLTKKIGYPLQALFFDWRLLENFKLFLDDIHIPVCEVHSIDEFNSRFETLKKDFLKNFDKEIDSDNNPIWELNQKNLKTEIITSVENIKSPTFLDDEILGDLIAIPEDHGTKFIIFDPEEQVLSLLDSSDENNDSEFVRTSLAGFTNQFVEDRLPLKTIFPIHKELGNDFDYFNRSGAFFEPNDFKLADIIIEGEFDGKGSFKGKLKLYNETIDYSFTNPRKKDKRSDYGQFPIKLGYSQGKESESKLDKANYNIINDKVDNYGALYLYRDGFRVLPYGRTEYDFLEFEKRRSKRAGTAFFSHRRMFGYIGLSRNNNPNLKDKSSREGLINNAYYRAFKNDLETFFKELAKDYFATEAKKPIFLDKKAEIKEQSEAIAKDKKREVEAKKALTRSLNDYPSNFDIYRKNYIILLEKLESNVSKPKIEYSKVEKLLSQIQQMDINYRQLLPQLPKSYKPTETQLDRLYKYENQINDFHENIRNESKALLQKVQKKLEIKDLRIEFEKQFIRYKAELESLVYNNKQALEAKLQSLSNEYADRSNRIINELNYSKDSIAETISVKEDVLKGTEVIKERFEFLREQIFKELEPLVNHVQKLTFDIDEELVQGAYKAEYEAIKYQWEQTRETAQLGIAVEIIDHEFNVLYAQINSSLNKLDRQIPEESNLIFEHLKKSFKSLEDKYSLLSPLYRISGVVAKNISCKALFEYSHHFFERKLKDENIKFTATARFKKHQIEIKEPVIHTVFINIINNALFWIRGADKKEIAFDYFTETDEIIIANSGLRIENHKLDKIFELFYSNRPNGRGIGLYLSKQSLNESYFDIYATNDKKYNLLNGACFVIKPLI